MTNGINGNGNGSSSRLQKWHIIVSAAGFVFGSVALVWNASGTSAQVQEKMQQMEKHLEYDDDHLARKDVIEPQLVNIQKGQEQEERELDKQAKLLDEIRVELMKRR